MRSVYDRHARQLKFSIHQFTYERKSYHGKSYHLYSYCRSCVRLPAACVAASACTWIVQSVNTNCGGEKSPPFSPPLIPQRENPLNLSVQFIERAALYTRLSHCFNGCNLPVSPSRYHSIPILGYLCAWSA